MTPATNQIMSGELEKAIFALIFSGIIGAIFKIYLDYKFQKLGNVLEKRTLAYTEFVKLTGLFSKYPIREVKWKDLYRLCEQFRDWYFEGHGVYISKEVKEKYFKLQELIINKSKDKENSIEEISQTDYDLFQNKCSEIRNQIALEVESRVSPIWSFFSRKSEN
ncbi:MAG: hypothetical protein KA536_15915 [Saprospiraceae bacterium]|nr:hypothetical protein [Saprospiraceae bacterium]